ncbi:MAG: hypothetical protein JST04_11155 [Bdellovibrionales bacterium]|nr:hypothetical protein [Bdellovibrionales bacterium]
MEKSRWIRGPGFDLAFFIGPAWFTAAAAIAVGVYARARELEIPSLGPYGWLALVLLVDVAHVYSTLFRTYLDPKERAEHRGALLWIPIAAWAVGALIHSVDPALFWRVLTYVAVFHFVRQQYGFLALYGAKDGSGVTPLDRAAVYAATLYPLVYWHAHLPRDFVWFIAGDFATGLPPAVELLARIAALAIGAAWILEQFSVRRRIGRFSATKVLWIVGTALAWNVGIVVFNSDLLFTLTNVVAHGVPYLALVWITGRTGSERDPRRVLSVGAYRIRSGRFFTLSLVPVYLGVLFLLAYLEEGFWDVWIWRDHVALFPEFHRFLGDFRPGPALTAILVALLTLPQATHYVLDGFIWRIRRPQDWARGLIPE